VNVEGELILDDRELLDELGETRGDVGSVVVQAGCDLAIRVQRVGARRLGVRRKGVD
jgi:hypothetical protein